MASFNYQDYQNDRNKTKQTTNNNNYHFSYFNLKKNGEEAIVRFMYDSPNEFNLYTIHTMQIDGKQRKVDCLHTPYDPISSCPICETGSKAQRKIFIKLLQYIKQEDGTIKTVPKIWERSDRYVDTLSNLFNEYGNLSDQVFKIRRNGEAGDTKTSYDIMYANPAIYKPELYVKDTTLFENFDFIKNGIITSKTYEELQDIVNVSQPQPTPTSTPQTPQYQPSQQPIQPQQPTHNEYNTTMPRRTFTY